MYLREIAGFDNDPAYSFFASLARIDMVAAAWPNASLPRSATIFDWASRSPAVTDSADRVDVVTAKGKRYSARRVVLAAPLNTLGDIDFTPTLPPALARLVEQGHTGRCVKVWSKVAGLEHVFAMGWPGMVECTLKATVHEADEERAIFASFGLEPDLAVDRRGPPAGRTRRTQVGRHGRGDLRPRLDPRSVLEGHLAGAATGTSARPRSCRDPLGCNPPGRRRLRRRLVRLGRRGHRIRQDGGSGGRRRL